MRSALWTPALLALILLAPQARAIGAFPGQIKAHLGLGYLPPCSICHATASGGGPMAKPFGLAMQERGLSPGDLSSVGRALDRMVADAVDSNGDDVTDVDALKRGTDPNDSSATSLIGPEPEYGCAVGPWGASRLGNRRLFITVAMMGGLVFLARKWRYPSCPSAAESRSGRSSRLPRTPTHDRD